MSELSDFVNDTAVPALLSAYGDAVVHWPAGVEADAETITAIVDLSEQTQVDAPAETENGRQLPRRITIDVEKTVNVICNRGRAENASVFIIDGQRWFAQKLHGETDGAGGLRTYVLVTTDRTATKRTTV